MSLSAPDDCLAHHSMKPFTTARDMGYVPCAAVAQTIKKYMDSHNSSTWATPESEALWFYGMNHGMALISMKYDQYEPLPDWCANFAANYHKVMSPKAVRAFYYLLAICTREARHNHNKHCLQGVFPSEVSSFFMYTLSGNGAWEAFKNSPPDTTLGEYCRALSYQFYHGNWNPGYGGPAWGAVADCLHRFVTGEFTPEMMMDTVWTLSHNNGPIFNKGILYHCYSSAHLLRVLDVQRAGQIPQAIIYDHNIHNYVEAELAWRMQGLQAAFPDDIGDHVDWYVVEALGALGNYASDKQAQKAKYGESPAVKAALAAAEAKSKAELAAKMKAEEEFYKNNFIVMPGVTVALHHREAA